MSTFLDLYLLSQAFFVYSVAVLFKRAFLCIVFTTVFAVVVKASPGTEKDTVSRVQLCLIIDVSGSMESLLYQAQTQIWNVLDHINSFQRKRKPTVVELALTALGSGTISEEQGHIQLLSHFTTDRDQLADQLFLLEANGSAEFFPRATQLALDELDWNESAVYKAIIIAGNEEFMQGNTDWESVVNKAKSNDIIVNTVFCGDGQTGIEMSWKLAAEQTGGSFTTITTQAATNTETPFDKHVVRMYNQYLKSYKDFTAYKWQEQLSKQKISPAYRDLLLYRFEHQPIKKDVIDTFEENDWDFDRLDPESFPLALKKMDERTLKEYLVRKAQERNNARDGVKMYQQKIQEFLKIKLQGQDTENTLDEVLKKIIGTQLKAQKFREVKTG